MKEDIYSSGLGAIGFIGAGKVGFSMGKYLSDSGEHLSGYYSRTLESAEQAATFTGAKAFDTFQFLRNGYFCVDCKDSSPEKLVFNRICSMKSGYKPQ